jgi:hypothetical protein
MGRGDPMAAGSARAADHEGRERRHRLRALRPGPRRFALGGQIAPARRDR